MLHPKQQKNIIGASLIFDYFIFPPQRVVVTPLGRTADSVTIQPGSVPVSPTFEEVNATAVKKTWWAFLRVSSVTVMQMEPGSCLDWLKECVTVRPRSVRGMVTLKSALCFLIWFGRGG